MANRFPLILDTTDNNKIKEIQAGDNLNLTDNSITGVQNITASGTIDAADIRVNGNRLVAQAFADLTDTPSSFVGAPNYFVKVKADGTGLEYRPLSDLGNIDIDTITVNTGIVPSVDGVGYLGTAAAKFNEVVAATLKGNLVSFNDEIVFDATTGKITYAALQGAPTFLSEFTNDVGYLRTVDLDAQIAGLFDEGQQFVTDIQGSVFGDDSTVLVDAVNSIITGDVLNTNVDTASVTASQVTSTAVTAQLFEGPAAGDMQIDAGTSGVINIGAGVSTTAVNIEKATLETFDQGSGLGVAQITAYTDLVINAGNRVKVIGAPFKIASLTATEILAVGAEEGDVVYNTTTARLQMFQGGAWKDINGNVEATAGQSDFNDVVIAGNLTVSGTTTTVDTTNTTISDNVIVLNNGESGAGVTAGTSGIEIDRGSEANKSFVWDDSVDKWTLGSETLVTGRVESIGVAASVFDSPEGTGILQIKAGSDAATGNIIFINPYGTDTYVRTKAETHVWATGAYSDLGTNPYVDFKTAGAFTAHDGAYFVGSLTGDIKGSVFGDDSTTLVDSVNGIIGGTLATTMPMSGGAIIDSADTNLELRNLNNFNVEADNVVNIIVDAQGAAPQWQFDNAGVLYLPNGMSIADNGNDLLLDASAGATNVVVFRTDGGDVFVDAAGVLNADQGVSGNVTGNVTGNIDNTTLTVGATDATTIAIGNASSTTTINGTVQLSALVAGEITADDSISITTAAGDGNAISIGPGGTNTYVNLTADNIRFFGPVTNVITAQGGITGDVTGDLTGSVFGDDSTTIIDGTDGTVYANNGVKLPNNKTVFWNAVGGIYPDAGNSLDIASEDGLSIGIAPGGGINWSFYQTGTLRLPAVDDNGWVKSTLETTLGDINLKPASTIVNIEGGLNTSDIIEAPGIISDLVGSVFADDSSPMVDAVDRAFIGDTMTLAVLTAEPNNIVDGMMAIADGTSWDPLTTGVQTLMVRLGGAWRQVQTA